MHAGIALVLGLWLFSATMMLLSFSAWLVPCEPRTLQPSRRSGADAFLAMWAHALSWPAIGKLARTARDVERTPPGPVAPPDD